MAAGLAQLTAPFSAGSGKIAINEPHCVSAGLNLAVPYRARFCAQQSLRLVLILILSIQAEAEGLGVDFQHHHYPKVRQAKHKAPRSHCLVSIKLGPFSRPSRTSPNRDQCLGSFRPKAPRQPATLSVWRYGLDGVKLAAKGSIPSCRETSLLARTPKSFWKEGGDSAPALLSFRRQEGTGHDALSCLLSDTHS